MAETEFEVTLETLCGCRAEKKWYGLPPQEIRVPIPRQFTFVGPEDQNKDLPAPAIRIRRFELVNYSGRFYSYKEVAEP
jgi:hypothetical protein